MRNKSELSNLSLSKIDAFGARLNTDKSTRPVCAQHTFFIYVFFYLTLDHISVLSYRCVLFILLLLLLLWFDSCNMYTSQANSFKQKR